MSLADEAAPLALWYVARGRAELRPVTLGPPRPGELRVRTLWTALSRGTERLVFEGRVPAGERERMRAPLQEGAFPFPVKYGYCAVGSVEAGPPEWLGRLAFCLHPHQEVFDAPLDLASLVPKGIPARRAVLAANMETALNVLWDAAAGPGDRIVVVGGGVVGLLVAYLAARLPGTGVTLVDLDRTRMDVAHAFGCAFSKPLDAPGEADVVVHASGSAPGLACALACGADEARIVEASWYGDEPVSVSLGLAFHSRRLKLVSSQVGAVPPARRPRWTPARRRAKALELLADDRLDMLITGEVALRDLPERLPALLAAGAPGLCTVVRHGEGES